LFFNLPKQVSFDFAQDGELVEPYFPELHCNHNLIVFKWKPGIKWKTEDRGQRTDAELDPRSQSGAFAWVPDRSPGSALRYERAGKEICVIRLATGKQASADKSVVAFCIYYW
jgi:hypothetical protein